MHCNFAADKATKFTNPVHDTIHVFVHAVRQKMAIRNVQWLSEEVEDSLDAIRMYVKGVLLEHTDDEDMDEEKIARSHNGICVDCLRKRNKDSNREKKCVGAARELEDRLLQSRVW